MNTNPELELANTLIAQTGTNIFLTGKAGTGKTTFLRSLVEKSPKRMIILAPTGIAAINAGGMTIHSFFQLPFHTLFLPASVCAIYTGYGFRRRCKIPFPLRERETEHYAEHRPACDRRD